MRKALAIRYGAYGDLFVALPLLEELKRRYEYVHLETGDRGKELLGNHPAFNRITTHDIMAHHRAGTNDAATAANLRCAGLIEGGAWNKVVNLWRTLECDCIAEEGQEEFYWPRERRREHFRDRIFVERPFIKAGLQIPKELRLGTIYFDTPTTLWMQHWKHMHNNTFNVVIAVSGSTCQKVPFGLDAVARRIIDTYPDARIFLVGDKPSGWMPQPIDPEELQFDFGMGNVCKMVGKTPYMQAVAMTKMADYVIGPVSSLLHAAGLFGTPKTMICTDCSVEQACKYHRNDFSVQSQAPCSPCHRAIYHTGYCLTEDTRFGKLPACNLAFDHERIMEGVAFAHGMREVRWSFDTIRPNSYSSIPDLKTGETSVPPPYGRHAFDILSEHVEGRKGLNIVEIGMSRRVGSQFMEGYSTPYFAHLAKRDGHSLYSVDISPDTAPLTEEVLKTYGLLGSHVQLLTRDGLAFLQEWDNGPIDVLYLDGWDYGPDDLRRREHFYSERMHLEAMQEAEPKMAPGALVLVDDMLCQETLVGKGTLVIPWLAERGWECLHLGWQVLMRKPQ